uniref:Protein Vpu n=1 Tax=Human immunodeficiency virus type 1 TaxID=11676 RepID=A0A0A1ECW6_HV1|nr:vpu protein [Human immunodeficiency virus 1]
MRFNLKLAIGALMVPLTKAFVVWTIANLENRKLVKQKKIDRLIKKIRERAKNSGNESDGNPQKLSTMVDMGRLGLLGVNDL